MNFITNKIQIQFFYYITTPTNKKRTRNRYNKQLRNFHFFNRKNTALKNLSKILQNIFGKRVELCANRIHYPYMNAQIFSQYLSNNSRARTFIHFTRSIFKFPSYNGKDLPTHIIGIKITLHGRLITERSVPRKTCKSKIQGTFTVKAPSGKDIAQGAKKIKPLIIDKGYTEIKNELGQFRISVEIAQRKNKILFSTEMRSN